MTDFSNRELAELLRSLEDLNEAEFVALRDESSVSDVLDVDSKMSDALFDVEVPADLRMRLLDLLTTNEDPLGNSMPETWASQAVNVTAELVAAESPRLPPAIHDGRPGRRRLNRVRLVLGVLLICASVTVGWLASQKSAQVSDATTIASVMPSWIHLIEEGQWQDKITKPQWLDIPSCVVTAQRSWASTDDGETAVIDLSGSRFGPAWLVVCQRDIQESLPREPFKQIEVSGAYRVGAWRSGGNVYVLIVPQGPSNLDDHIDLPSLS